MRRIAAQYSLGLLAAVAIYSCSTEQESGISLIISEGFNQTQPQEITKAEFIELSSEDLFLVKTKQIENVIYSVKRIPTDLMALRVLGDNYSDQRLDSVRSKLQGIEYYELRIEIPNAGTEIAKVGVNSMAEYEDRIKFMSFGMQENFGLKIGKESEVGCLVYHFERTYNVAPFSTFLLGFEVDEAASSGKERVLTFNDQLFGAGPVRFKWEWNELNWVPKIKTDVD